MTVIVIYAMGYLIVWTWIIITTLIGAKQHYNPSKDIFWEYWVDQYWSKRCMIDNIILSILWPITLYIILFCNRKEN